MPPDVFFESWSGVGRILAVGVIAYCALILTLRATGKRTLSKLNAFDLIVTVALGSTLASVITSRTLPLVEGLAALVLLILLQYGVTYLSVRSSHVARWVKAEPTLLVRNGQALHEAMRRERITEDEIRAAIRSSGGEKLQDASFVILESDGSLTTALR